ncbi:hypothetical protein [Flavobacterium sp.]|uniref:hypothetical protein n=1 Tax=Flavobacterium sp. TaxID=239 RepID=UPI0025E57DFE|nr:hypothetical protein [Flavobacterium sp.]
MEYERTTQSISLSEVDKQETLEEVAEEYSDFWLQNKGLLIKDAQKWEWQAERMYSEDDIMSAYKQGARLALISQSDLALVKGKFPTPEEFLETFKK